MQEVLLINGSHHMLASSKLSTSVLAMPRLAKRLVAVFVDVCLCILSVWLALYLRLGEFVNLSGPALIPVVVSIVLAIPIFIISGLYRVIFRYSGWPALLAVAKAIAIYAVGFATIITAIGFQDVPRTLGFIQPLLLLLFVGASRTCVRFWLGGIYQNQLLRYSAPKVLIYGAGTAGQMLARAIASGHEMSVVGFLDDDPFLQKHIVHGFPVYSPDGIKDLSNRHKIDSVLLALPSAGRKRRGEILTKLLDTQISVRILPAVTELAQGKISFSELRHVEIEDLLGREPVDPDAALLSKNIHNKIVLVTGAGGSIGSELCRQILDIGPSTLLMLEQSEYALYNIHQELEQRNITKVRLTPLLGSTCDAERIRHIFDAWKPETIYHAAAFKHVPLVEQNIAAGVKNNIFGTLVVAQLADLYGAEEFVLISTDKAVRPTNIMGATKRLAEMILQALADEQPKTKFTMVRFGNVLGSSGSVVPKFRQQIKTGGPITITHEEITRYFMTIPEASQLVIQAAAMAEGGDLFVLDMGEPVKIRDLAARMIELSGLSIRNEENPDGDIEIKVTALRPGEKLYEELLIGNEPELTPHPRIMKAREEYVPWEQLKKELDGLEAAIQEQDLERVRRILMSLVSGYKPTHDIVDFVGIQKRGISGHNVNV